MANHSLSYDLGEGSPLARIHELDGWVLLLGVGRGNNTSLHLAEHRAGFHRALEVRYRPQRAHRVHEAEARVEVEAEGSGHRLGTDLALEVPQPHVVRGEPQRSVYLKRREALASVEHQGGDGRDRAARTPRCRRSSGTRPARWCQGSAS
ncbi:AAC(3) family N-acetyltransferase [Sorangium sp. So ce291]